MDEFAGHYELLFRLASFVAIFAVMAAWELVAPCRAPTVSRALRWANNLGLVALNTLLVRLLFPAAAVGMAAVAAGHGWGVLQRVEWPFALELLIALVVLDLVIWLQHVMVHAVPALWRLHRVHHADLDYDLTTGNRFHPLEIVLSMGIKFAAVTLLGPAPLAVLLFEVILNGMAMFNHANVQLPPALDRWLRRVFVTPDMHRVHHSVEDDEANSNFGFNLSWWDRLFGTYREQPRGGHVGMVIGIRDHRRVDEVSRLAGLLMLPFRGPISDYVINRRHWSGGADDQERPRDRDGG